MEFEPWYLSALPVLFAVGWWARGHEARVRAADQGAAPRSLFRGLQLLLSDQPDRAIDAFIEVVKLDPETIELHYALGSLFRRRGEIDRAVRIHNYLLSRADLPAAERANALAELGQDYLNGGMIDRAENAFGRLLDEREHRFEALRALLRVYQMEREWARAIECARQLESEAGETHKVATAHFHCELAGQAIAADDLDRAWEQVQLALKAHRKSVRAAMLAGDIALRRSRRPDAIAHWLRIVAEAPEYAPLVMDRLMAALDAEERRAEAVALLRRLIQSQAQKLARYRCSQCGFRSREFYWNCPGCTNWDSYPPRRIEELE